MAIGAVTNREPEVNIAQMLDEMVLRDALAATPTGRRLGMPLAVRALAAH